MTSMEQQAIELFPRDVAEHKMNVKHDAGLYRHLRFDRQGSQMYHFEIVTWPGYLTISGDMGCFTFRRITDMFRFFGGNGQIDLRYWAEKLQAASDGPRAFSRNAFRAAVRGHFEECREWNPDRDWAAVWVAIENEVLTAEDEREAHICLEAFEYDGFQFSDVWEWDVREWGYRFVWCCLAIRWAVEQHVAAGGTVSDVAE